MRDVPLLRFAAPLPLYIMYSAFWYYEPSYAALMQLRGFPVPGVRQFLQLVLPQVLADERQRQAAAARARRVNARQQGLQVAPSPDMSKGRAGLLGLRSSQPHLQELVLSSARLSRQAAEVVRGLVDSSVQASAAPQLQTAHAVRSGHRSQFLCGLQVLEHPGGERLLKLWELVRKRSRTHNGRPSMLSG